MLHTGLWRRRCRPPGQNIGQLAHKRAKALVKLSLLLCEGVADVDLPLSFAWRNGSETELALYNPNTCCPLHSV